MGSSGFLIIPWLLLAESAALFSAGVSSGKSTPAVFVFGDSILDTGNNNYLPTLSKCNFPPYGRNFPGGKPTGRFTDGKVISDLLKLFQEYKGKLKGLAGEQRSNVIVNQSLYLISSGNNDIGLTYFLTNRHLEYDMTSYASFLVTQASESIVELYKLGARKIGVFSTLVSGCVPEGRTVGGGEERKCAENFNELAKIYNGKLSFEMDYLNKQLPGVKMVFVDLFSPLLGIIKDPETYGFAVTKEGCCGTGYIEAAVLCNQLSPFTCANTSEYIFWDRVDSGESNPAAVYVFGDSIMDTGNNDYILTRARCDYPPYGRNFPGGKPTGRFSDGKIIPDLIVENLGIKDLLSPYLDPNLGPEDLITGVAFASGGCGFDPETIRSMMALSIPTQLILFQEYKDKLKANVGEQRSDDIINRSLYLLSSGNNDIGSTYFLTNRHLEYDMTSYAAFLATQASESLVELYKLGARKIGVFSTLVPGCVPQGRTVGGGGRERECAEDFNELARLYNGKLISEIEYLNDHLPGLKIVFVDLYGPLLGIIQDPQRYGFVDVKDGCCGTGELEFAVLCNQLSSTCINASNYIFWDSVHLTEKAYKILTSEIMKDINKLQNEIKC
ncbi:unnamed protein product [Linum tenue]|uniref:Uncharacterized protein n=1 Tax=Linum tenue TaxID=586396 RepID=A0AAV0LN97_9ROSI|nr:unnamed protein product [Linum tenue]